jgi:hypothetical protein
LFLTFFHYAKNQKQLQNSLKSPNLPLLMHLLCVGDGVGCSEDGVCLCVLVVLLVVVAVVVIVTVYMFVLCACVYLTFVGFLLTQL